MTAEPQTAAREIEEYFRDTSSNLDPYPAFARLREHEPVHWSEALQYWIVTGFSEGSTLYRNPSMSRHQASDRQFAWLVRPDDPPKLRHDVATWTTTILGMDNPDHMRVRRLLQPAFTPSALERWAPRIESIAAGLFERVAGRSEFDFLSEIAYPVAEQVVCEVMGVPFADHEIWKEWSGVLSNAAVLAAQDDRRSEESRREAAWAMSKWCDYFRTLIEERRGGDGDDLISELIRIEEEGDRLTPDELIGSCILIISAGHGTTANLIGNAMLSLLRNPEQYDLLRADPELAPAVIEETLRYDSPSRSQPRVALEDVEIAGQTIKAGDMVMVTANACNRDPRRYDDVDTFDIRRADTAHIGFVVGIHFCLGATLARMESTAAIRQVATMADRLELAEWPLPYRPTHGRALERLPVRRVG